MLSTSIEHAAPLPTQKDYMLNVDAPSTAIQKIVLAMAIAGCIGVAAITAPREPATAAHAPLALVGGMLIDGGAGQPVRNSVVLIRGERIEKVGTIDAVPVPTGHET